MTFPTETFSPETIQAIELALRIGIIVLGLGIICATIYSIVSRIGKGKTRVQQVKVHQDDSKIIEPSEQSASNEK